MDVYAFSKKKIFFSSFFYSYLTLYFFFPANFYRFTLSTPVTYDASCILPTCLPNSNLNVNDLDLANCKVIAGGTVSDTFNAATGDFSEKFSSCASLDLDR